MAKLQILCAQREELIKLCHRSMKISAGGMINNLNSPEENGNCSEFWLIKTSPTIPIGCNFDVQGHFHIEQVLIFLQVPSHLTLCGSQLVLQFVDCILWDGTTLTV